MYIRKYWFRFSQKKHWKSHYNDTSNLKNSVSFLWYFVYLFCQNMLIFWVILLHLESQVTVLLYWSWESCPSLQNVLPWKSVNHLCVLLTLASATSSLLFPQLSIDNNNKNSWCCSCFSHLPTRRKISNFYWHVCCLSPCLFVCLSAVIVVCRVLPTNHKALHVRGVIDNVYV